jgi:signal transduction histidine kinase
MIQLARWLEQHRDTLIQAAVVELSQDEALRSQVVGSVEAFFSALIQAAELGEPAPIEGVLTKWVASRSAPTEDEPTGGIVPALALFKRVTWEQIQRLAKPNETVSLLTATDTIYTEALIHLSRLEANALLADMRRQLAEAQAYVKQLDKRKSDFVAVAAHELKTPLTVIEGYNDMLRLTLQSSGAHTGLLLEGMGNGVKRLHEIIQDMIDVSLISLDALTLNWQPVRFPSLLDALENHISDVLGQRQVELVIDRASLPQQPTYADPQRLLQVFLKVVSNAIKYTPDGGRVSVAARELPGFTDVMIEDTGIGIDPSNIAHIFDVFSSQAELSLHSSGKTKFKGAGPGLGLAIAKGIVEAHGGNIWAVSPGYDEQNCPGSTFHVMIPMRVDEALASSS